MVTPTNSRPGLTQIREKSAQVMEYEQQVGVHVPLL
eukprot:SAG11_NODE_1644_length_4526_cov_1.563813_6_plen_36_part_00